MRATSDSWTSAGLAILRLSFALLLERRWRRLALERTSFPVAVTRNLLATDLRVLLRAIDFGMRKG